MQCLRTRKWLEKAILLSKVLKGKGREGGSAFGGRIYKERVDFESFSRRRKERVNSVRKWKERDRSIEK